MVAPPGDQGLGPGVVHGPERAAEDGRRPRTANL